MKLGAGWIIAAVLSVTLSTDSLAQEKPARLTFDVATIRLAKPGAIRGGIKPLPGGNGYTAQTIPLRLMVALMYKVPVRQIAGGPEWLDSDLWDIEARADKAYTIDELHEMMKNLFADRFGLKFHKETKEGNVYALEVDKAVKMKPDGTGQALSIPIVPGAGGVFTGTRVPMVYLCWFLGQVLQRDERPVIDKTGLTDSYDFTLAFLPDLPPDFNKDSLPPGMLDRPSIFDAVKVDLGLKLVPEKGPVEFYVVDRLERPSEN
jgi:uncharacterized protein (TIGR03435 family)